MLCSKPSPNSTFYPEKKPNCLQKALCVQALGTSPISFLSTLQLGLSIWPRWPRCCSTNIPQGLCTGSSPPPPPPPGCSALNIHIARLTDHLLRDAPQPPSLSWPFLSLSILFPCFTFPIALTTTQHTTLCPIC